jgi:hypothetical protein
VQGWVKSTLLSDEEIARRWRTLERLQRELVDTADRGGNKSVASRVHLWFNVRMVEPGRELGSGLPRASRISGMRRSSS